MPNWCEGTLKVRGTFENLKKFVLQGLRPVNVLGADVGPLVVEDPQSEYDLYIYNIKNSLYMEGTRRHFCDPAEIELYADGPDEVITLFLPMRAAWCIGADDLLQLCQKFHVDMKIQGFEKGMQFSQIVEIVDSEIVQDEEIEYDDWDWDCPCPELGG